jgi:hypothetical protein
LIPCLFVAIAEAALPEEEEEEEALAEALKKQKDLLVAEGSEPRQLPALSAANPA